MPATLSAAPPEACAWCGARYDDDASRLTGRTRCGGCGVASTDPWPTDAVLDAAYADWYRPQAGRFSGPGDTLLRRSRGRLALRIDAIAPTGPVLDVGSGDGALLDALRARGREAVGLERASERDDVRTQEITDVTDGGWAAIVFWHSLEHLRTPVAALRHAASLLAPRGVLLVAVPNAASVQAAAFGDRWLALDLPRHLTHTTTGALTDALSNAGLTIERVSYWRGGQVLFGFLHGLVARLPGHPSLYDAIRRPAAREHVQSPLARAVTVASGVVLAPIAVVGAAAEILLRRGGTVYVEARR